jgi:hypothetical protein
MNETERIEEIYKRLDLPELSNRTFGVLPVTEKILDRIEAIEKRLKRIEKVTWYNA